jgi:PPOX class probable F420-dependent enzyme
LDKDKSGQFTKRKYINLETYKKDGEAVRTPVWFVEYDGIIYVRTDENSGKIKRSRNNPDTRIVPCNFLGHPKGYWSNGKIMTCSTLEKEKATYLFKEKYGLQEKILQMIYKIKQFKLIIISVRLLQ